MAKFHLHRIERMTTNPAEAKITPGLEAAAYLHWITCYERDPKSFAALESQLTELRKELADYQELTARETAAHLELKSALLEKNQDVTGTKDFRAEPVEAAPSRVARVNAQFGWNWVLLDWDAPGAGGKPWGYRVYRTDKRRASVLVATVVAPEALLPQQPEGLKLYYYVTAFNAAGETPPSPEFGLMLNAPDEIETSAAAPDREPAEKTPRFPEHEMPTRRELGEAMMKFVQKLGATRLGDDQEDAVMRQVVTEEYRQAVEQAARQNIEVSLAWNTLAFWTEDGKERIGYFARALECRRAESTANPPQTAVAIWASIHMQADCLFEIGRVHFHEGAPETARRFLCEALPLAQQADALQAAAKATDDRLEGRIAELLLRLPEEPQA